MATLVINAPKWRANRDKTRSYEETLRSGVGDSYAISKKFYSQIEKDCNVILLCKDKKRRAEGTLVKLVPTTKTGSGLQRYDVHMKNLREVEYSSEPLNRNGVNII